MFMIFICAVYSLADTAAAAFGGMCTGALAVLADVVGVIGSHDDYILVL